MCSAFRNPTQATQLGATARSAKLGVATLAALALASAAGLPARALFITSERAVGLVKDSNAFATVREDTSDTAAGRDLAAVFLGDGTNAFGQQTVAGAFGAFPTQQGVYWVVLNADNSPNLSDDGRGFARVQLTSKAIKQFGETAFVLNIVPGLLEIDDGEGQSTTLSTAVSLDAGGLRPLRDQADRRQRPCGPGRPWRHVPDGDVRPGLHRARCDAHEAERRRK